MTTIGSDGNIDTEKYYDILEQVEKVSGLSESDYVIKDKPLSMNDIDSLLTKVLTDYLDVSKKG